MEFKVKREFLLIFLINVVLAFLLGVCIPFAYNLWVFLVVLAIVLTMIVFYNTAVIFATCKLDDNMLIFKTGVFKYEIDINQVKKVTREKNCYGSLALSTDRIRLLTVDQSKKQRVFYISVVDNDKLVSILNEKIAPQKSGKVNNDAPKKVATKKTKTINKK